MSELGHILQEVGDYKQCTLCGENTYHGGFDVNDACPVRVMAQEFAKDKPHKLRGKAPISLRHVFRRYHTGIGWGGYKECTLCGLNNYDGDLDENSKCPVRLMAEQFLKDKLHLNPTYRRPNFETMNKEDLIGILDIIRDKAASSIAELKQIVIKMLKVDIKPKKPSKGRL